MNKHNAKDFLPLVQALADGKTIQFKHISGWADHESPSFDGQEPERFRIKPEPREWVLNLYEDGDAYLHASLDSAKLASGYSIKKCHQIRIREILD